MNLLFVVPDKEKDLGNSEFENHNFISGYYPA